MVSQAPRVADAIERARTADLARDAAAQDLESANAAMDAAQAVVAAAGKAVNTAHAAGAVAGLIGMRIGPSAPQLAELAQAERRLQQIAREAERAQLALYAAQQRSHQADREREHATREFAALCRSEAASAPHAVRAIPL